MKHKQILLFVMLALAKGLCAEEINDSIVYKLDDVVVTGTRTNTDIRHLPMTISVIGREKLTENYQNSVMPALSQHVPGMFVTSRGLIGYGVSTGAAGGMKIRGVGSMANLLVLIDGLPQYAGMYGHPVADSYQTMIAERLEVLRGPASMIYGSNAMGGVVNIVTRQMKENGVNTNINLQGGSYGTIQADAVNRMRFGKFSSIAGVSYDRTDGHRSNSEFEQVAGFLKLNYDLSKIWKMSGDVNLTNFKSSNPGEDTNPYIDNDMKITRGFASISVTNSYENTNGALRLYYNWGYHNINDGYHPGGSPRTAYYIHDDRMGGFSLYQSLSLFSGNRITAGIDFQHFGGHAWNRAMADGKETDIANRSANEIAGYVDVRQDIASWMTIDAGVRLDNHSVSGSEWIPQGGFTFRLPDNAELRAMVSKGFRNATIREMYMFRPANANLHPESMMNYELSYKQTKMDGRLNYGVNLFYLKAENMIQTTMVDGKMLNINTGKTENSGMEVEAGYRMNNNLSINGNYSFLHMSNPQLSAPEHKLFIGVNYNLHRFSVNTGLQYIAGLYTSVGEKELKENYWLLNLTTHYKVNEKMHIFIKGDNLLAQGYESVGGFPMPRVTVMGGISFNF